MKVSMATIDNNLAPIHLDVETVLEKVIEQFPGTEVLWDDLHNQLKIDYAIRIQASALSNRPYSPRMQRRIMDDIVNKMNGKAILIRLKCGNIVGLALDRSLNFYSKSEFNQESKKRLDIIYAKLNVNWCVVQGHVPDNWAELFTK